MSADTYQFTVEKDDIVRLPNGIVGIVSEVDILMGGCVKEVKIRPYVSMLKKFLFFFSDKMRYYDDDINKLQKLGKAQFRD